MTWRDFCLNAMRKHAPQLQQAVNDTPPQHSAMLPTEVCAFMAVCHELGLRKIVESGRARGYSTELMVRSGLFDVISIENQPMKEYDDRLLGIRSDRLTLLTGSGNTLVAGFCDEATAILLDGPKNMSGLDLLETLVHAPLVAVHDLCRLQSDTSEPNPGRARAEVMDAFFTDGASFLAEFGHLDDDMLTYRGLGPHASFIQQTCVLGIFDNKALKAGDTK